MNNTLTAPFAVLNQVNKTATSDSEPGYASAAHTAALLRFGAEYRKNRISAADMITTDEAAELSGATRVTINAWIKSGQCIGLTHLRRGYKLPKWQFEPHVFPAVKPIAKALGTTDGWELLSFLESPHPALDGLNPRAALEQGVSASRIVDLATDQGH